MQRQVVTKTVIDPMQRESFLILLMPYIKIPYLWGGKDKSIGLDCSGLVHNVMRELNLAPPQIMTANDQFGYYSGKGIRVLQRSIDLGDLLYFGDKDHIHHTAIALNNFLMIEAAHGDSTITSIEIAKQKGAQVMVNPISRFKDYYAAIRPSGRPW